MSILLKRPNRTCMHFLSRACYRYLEIRIKQNGLGLLGLSDVIMFQDKYVYHYVKTFHYVQKWLPVLFSLFVIRKSMLCPYVIIILFVTLFPLSARLTLSKSVTRHSTNSGYNKQIFREPHGSFYPEFTFHVSCCR